MDPSRLGLASFAVAAVALALLGSALVLRASKGPSDRLFRLVVLAQATWAASMTLGHSAHDTAWTDAAVGAEALRNVAWTAFLASLPSDPPAHATRWSATRLFGVRGTATLLAVVLAGSAIVGAIADTGSQVIGGLFIGAAVLGLVVLEQVHRNATQAQRWSIKFLSVCALGVFGFDLMIYTQSMIDARIDPSWWAARGIATALLVPLLALAAVRRDDWRIGLSISHKVIFHTAALFGAGAYLVLAAIGSYYVGRLGGQWGDVAQAVLLFGAAVGLVFFALSETLRARIRVLVAKHFFNYRYDYREEWLRLTRLLSAPADGDDGHESLSRRSLEALSSMVEATGGALWRQEGEHFDFVTGFAYEGPTDSIPADHPIACYLREREWVVDVAEARDDPARYPNMRLHPVFDAPRAWLVVPLILGDDLLGIALLLQPRAPFNVNWEVRDLLKTSGRQIASHLGVRQAVEQLLQSRQFDSFNRMSAFVVHDLKNLVSQLTLLTRNASRHHGNPEFQQDMLATVENVVERMQALLRQLRAGTKPIEQPGSVSVRDVLNAVVLARRDATPVPRLELPGAGPLRVTAHEDRLERVIGHLIQNAIEACEAAGEVIVRADARLGEVVVEVADTGVGMSAEFVRTRLFRPFVSTKSHGMGIGTFESREYLREIGGEIEVESAPGRGTVFRIRMPATDHASSKTQDLIDG